MSRLCQERWNALLSRLNLADDGVALTQLTAAYSELHRHYHTDEHVAACLAWLDRIDRSIPHKDEIELALWFHDGVYAPRSSTNEADSAVWAMRFLTAAGANAETIDRVQGLILATAHGSPPQTEAQTLIVDIDLSILGSAPADYNRYEAAIRREYAWAPGFLFRRKRKAIPQSFLDRPHLYTTAFFRERLETQAHINLTRAIAKLR